MEKKIRVLCDLGVGGERGRVFDRNCVVGALSSTDYKDPPKAIKRLDISKVETTTRTDRVIVLGGIGRNERKNRDSMRVISGHGTMYALPAHIYKENPVVIKKWKKDLT